MSDCTQQATTAQETQVRCAPGSTPITRAEFRQEDVPPCSLLSPRGKRFFPARRLYPSRQLCYNPLRPRFRERTLNTPLPTLVSAFNHQDGHFSSAFAVLNQPSQPAPSPQPPSPSQTGIVSSPSNPWVVSSTRPIQRVTILGRVPHPCRVLCHRAGILK